ncbi:hypothetical protein [Aureivirga sp. CE67]|uniref:hypothetical protein n=1 Tax=Aureivirga sp. CE67 TaxID=1788983 RepID=UPI0018C8DA6B|nr:hypothetical protein [Aureivirga sp. CE67]
MKRIGDSENTSVFLKIKGDISKSFNMNFETKKLTRKKLSFIYAKDVSFFDAPVFTIDCPSNGKYSAVYKDLDTALEKAVTCNKDKNCKENCYTTISYHPLMSE